MIIKIDRGKIGTCERYIEREREIESNERGRQNE